MQYRFSGLRPRSRSASRRSVSPAFTSFAVCAALAALSTAPAFAANALTTAEVQVKPGFETAVVRVTTTGDDNANASGTLQYRRKGETYWHPGHPLVRSLPNRLSSLLINLRENTAYEVTVTPADPDGAIAPIVTAFTTRATPQPLASGRTLNVSTTGSPAPDGSATAPYGRIADAVRAAQPGDTILVAPGLYREEVYNFTVSGTPQAPITIKAAAPGVHMVGTLASLEEPHVLPLWKRQADGTWSTQLPAMTAYVAVNGTRLFHSRSQADLQTAAASGGSGWWLDASNVLYVTLPGGISPDTVSMQVGQMGQAFHFMSVHDIIVDGIDMGFYGAGFSVGVYLHGASNITIRHCTIHNVSYGVFMKEAASDNIIENCNIFDRGLDAWDWASVKGTDAEGVGIMIGQAGAGNVVRRNNIHDIFNGVAVIGDGENSSDTDIYYNWIHDIGDDGIEPESAGVDFRAWCNTVRGTQNSISLAPIDIGPAWVMYNTLSQFRQSGLKVSNGSSGPVMAYHNTIYTTLPGVNALSPWTAMKNFTLRNNIIVGTRYVIEDYYTSPAMNASFDGDVLYTTDSSRFVKLADTQYFTLAALQAAGYERNGAAAAPKFVGASYGDFRLLATSPGRHKAVSIPGINDFFVSTPDAGALQMGQ